MKKNFFAGVMLMLMLLLAACGRTDAQVTEAIPSPAPAAAQPTDTPVPTPAPTDTPALTDTPTPAPTDTPTPTTEPTATPVPEITLDQKPLYVCRPGKKVNLRFLYPDSKKLGPRKVEIRLEDGTVVGADTVDKTEGRIAATLPEGTYPARTTLYLYQEGTEYPVSQKDIAVIDPEYKGVKGNYEREDKMIALTFDCAYGETYTDYILDLLRKYEIKATFFMVGTWVGNHGPWIEKMLADGHELGNHTQTHPRFSKISNEAIYKTIMQCDARLLEKVNYQSHIMRPPYGSHTPESDAITRYCGYEAILWALSARDSREGITKETILRTLKAETEPGDIVLMHNGAASVTYYLEPYLQFLIENGYTFGTVSELMGWETPIREAVPSAQTETTESPAPFAQP